MTISKFMERALFDPVHGYYSTKETIFNKGGDFTTSPEISQMFGEMIAVWMIAAKNKYEAPHNTGSLHLLEVGPGSGAMMEDIMRSIGVFTNNLSDMHVGMVDASSNLKSI